MAGPENHKRPIYSQWIVSTRAHWANKKQKKPSLVLELSHYPKYSVYHFIWLKIYEQGKFYLNIEERGN